MSAVIPYDLLPAISAYFFTEQQQPWVQPPPTPTVLHLPRQLRLDCLMPPMPPMSGLPVPVPLPLPQPPAAPVVAPPSTRRSAFSHSHPHHPALVIPPAALRADLTTDDPTPPPLAPDQIIPLPPLALTLAPALAPTHVPLPPSPVDNNNTRSDEPEIKIRVKRHASPPLPLSQPCELDGDGLLSRSRGGGAPQQLLLLSSTVTSTSTATVEPSKEVLEAIEEAASSALPIPIPISILPPSPPPPPPLSSVVMVVPQHGRRSTAPLQPLTNGIIHGNGYSGKRVSGNGNGNAIANAIANGVPAKGRGISVNPIFVKGTPTHPIHNGVPSTPFPTSQEFATPPPPLPTHGNGRRPMVVHGPLIGNLLLSSCPGKKGAFGDPPTGCVACLIYHFFVSEVEWACQRTRDDLSELGS